MWRFVIYVALGGVGFGADIAILAAFWVIQWRRKKEISGKMLGLSIQTTSESVSFDQGSQGTGDSPIVVESTPRNWWVETYTVEELRKATEDFSLSNLIEGSVFHGSLDGKNLAIKGTNTEPLAKVELGFFHDATHHHPNIIKLIGTCSTEGTDDSFMVFVYAKNRSLKDWLHGRLAMKSHFIASCYYFLNWNQRLKICLDNQRRHGLTLHAPHHDP